MEGEQPLSQTLAGGAFSSIFFSMRSVLDLLMRNLLIGPPFLVRPGELPRASRKLESP